MEKLELFFDDVSDSFIFNGDMVIAWFSSIFCVKFHNIPSRINHYQIPIWANHSILNGFTKSLALGIWFATRSYKTVEFYNIRIIPWKSQTLREEGTESHGSQADSRVAWGL